MSIEVMMIKFEKELLKYINDTFSVEIEKKIIEIATNRDEPKSIIAQETHSGDFEYRAIESSENWMIEVVRKTEKSRHIRVVIKSPDVTTINKIMDYQSVIEEMVEMAKNILYTPPFEKYVNQGMVQLSEGEQIKIEFVPRDKLRKSGKEING